MTLSSFSENGVRVDLPYTSEVEVISTKAGTRWNYSVSKIADEALCMSFAKHFGIPTVITRFFNTVGPRQTGRYGMVVPRFVQQALQGAPITVYGSGTQTRCFCHVRDVVWALMRLLTSPATRGELYNVGNNEEVSINDLAALVRTMTASDSEIRHIPYHEAFGSGFEDMERRVPDLRKIHQAIGYRPRHSLGDILREVIEHERSTGARRGGD